MHHYEGVIPMISYDWLEVVAAERRTALMADAETARLAKLAKSHRQATGTSRSTSSLWRQARNWWRSGRRAPALHGVGGATDTQPAAVSGS
jgi:hypothetical protein